MCFEFFFFFNLTDKCEAKILIAISMHLKTFHDTDAYVGFRGVNSGPNTSWMLEYVEVLNSSEQRDKL
jgi:hypothetical protein